MSLAQLVYRHRLVGKRLVAALSRVLPQVAARRLRTLTERIAYNLTPHYQDNTLPPIFAYWSSVHLAKDARRMGIDSPEAFFFDSIMRNTRSDGELVRVLSVGCGAASMEIELALLLREAGVPAFITCMDFNRTLIERAAKAAREQAVDACMGFVIQDCNRAFELQAQDAIIVNQFFHHVESLETFCASLRRSLAADGVLLSSDIVGRNGHQLWPDIDHVVQRVWTTLPADKRHDRYFNAPQATYRSVNHAAYSNEGVRAQDVVACLLAEFDFELFFSFGGTVMPFVERRIGFNFDAGNDFDRALIDRIHGDDAAALLEARYPASNMIAALRHKGTAAHVRYHPVSPQRHVALTRQQQERANP